MAQVNSAISLQGRIITPMTDGFSLSPDTAMKDILSHFPGAKRALFSSYHIGGCQSCAYGDDETVASVCQRNELQVDEVIQQIVESHKHDQAFLISPADLAKRLKTETLILLDTRTREEHEAVKIDSSELLTQERQQSLFAKPPKETIVLYDHTGDRVLDTCSWFSGHGVKNCLALHGGIDAWSQDIDQKLPRYRLEIE